MDNFDNNEEKLRELLKQLEELKELRASLASKEENISKTEKEKEEEIEKAKSEATELSKSNVVVEELKRQVIELDKEIERLEEELIDNVKEYEKSYSNLQNLIKEQSEKLDSNELLSEYAIASIKADYEKLEEDESIKANEIRNIYERQRKLISALKTKRTKLKKDIEKCEALDLTMEEYNEISSALRKAKIVDAILEKKGLIDIISKPSTERTKEEKEKLKDAKEEIFKEIAEMKKNNDYSALDAIQALYSIDPTCKKVKTRTIEIPKNELEKIKGNTKSLPTMVADYNKAPQNKEYNPAPKDMKEEVKKEETINSEESIINPNINERIIIFKDKETGDLYIREYVRQKFKDRFKLYTYGEGVRINGSVCYKIDQDEADYIINNANNDFSPYLTRIDEIELPKKEEEEEKPKQKVYTADDYNMVQEGFDELVSEGYTPGTEEFNEALRNSGYIGTPIDLDESKEETVEETSDNTEDKSEDKSEDKFEDKSESNEFVIGPEDTLDELIPGTDIKRPRYRKTHESDEEYEEFLKNYYNKVFADKDNTKEDDKDTSVPIKENKEEKKEETSFVNPTPIPVGDDDKREKPKDDQEGIKEEQKEENEDVQEEEKKEEILSARYIISEKLTKDLFIPKKSGKRYAATKIKVTQEFKNELHAGNYIYNILHIVGALAKIPIRFANKTFSSLMLGAEGKEVMEELDRRLHDPKLITEKDLQILYDQYKGTTALSDMNHQILPVIQMRLREWILEKVKVNNAKITQCYSIVAFIKEQLEEIDKKLADPNLDPKLREEYLKQRKELIRQAGENIKQIEELNLEGQKWLSDGLHGLEEDYKAVMTKMNYVGLRFAKEHDFDNELASKIGVADQKLKEAIRDDEPDKIYEKFMEREQVYIDNTEIKNSIFGKRSVGKKYYTPLAQVLDYRDDPLIRDLMTTIALTTAAISVINAIRVHQIEDKLLLEQQQHDAAAINAANDRLLHGVGDEAQKIVDGRTAIREGLQAQAHNDVLNTANGLERYALDHFNWATRGNGYRALDDANHLTYNTMYQQVTGDINSVTSGLSSGTITSAQALQDMGVIAAGAQNTFVDVAKTCLAELKQYIPAHPQYDLTATEAALEYIIANPTALTRMNEAAINATNIAEGLIGLSPAHVQALSALPSDWLTTLMGAAGSAALAYNVTKDMAKVHDEKSRVKQSREESQKIADKLKGIVREDPTEETSVDELIDDSLNEEEDEQVNTR